MPARRQTQRTSRTNFRSKFAQMERRRPMDLYVDDFGRYYWQTKKGKGKIFNMFMSRRLRDPAATFSDMVYDEDIVDFPLVDSRVSLKHAVTNATYGTFRVSGYVDAGSHDRGKRGGKVLLDYQAEERYQPPPPIDEQMTHEQLMQTVPEPLRRIIEEEMDREWIRRQLFESLSSTTSREAGERGRGRGGGSG